MASGKLNFVLAAETAKMARALDGLGGPELKFVADTLKLFGSEGLEAEEISVNKEAGLLAMRFERLCDADKNVVKGLVSRFIAKSKEKASSSGNGAAAKGDGKR